MKLAVFGGSFNPVHIGHLAAADAAHLAFGYDRVLLIPANIPPHKQLAGAVTAAARLEMLSLAVRDSDTLAVDSCEIERSGVSWTIDTLKDLQLRYAGTLEGKIGLIIGEDLVADFYSWKDPEGILEIADLITVRRPGSPPVSAPFPCRRLENPLLSISSSEIRSLIKTGGSWRYLVPESVYRYIVINKLYG